MISSNISFLFSSFSSLLIIVFILFDFYLVHCSNTPQPDCCVHFY